MEVDVDLKITQCETASPIEDGKCCHKISSDDLIFGSQQSVCHKRLAPPWKCHPVHTMAWLGKKRVQIQASFKIKEKELRNYRHSHIVS